MGHGGGGGDFLGWSSMGGGRGRGMKVVVVVSC